MREDLGACEKGFSCTWWTMEHRAEGWREAEALKNFGVKWNNLRACVSNTRRVISIKDKRYRCTVSESANFVERGVLAHARRSASARLKGGSSHGDIQVKEDMPASQSFPGSKACQLSPEAGWRTRGIGAVGEVKPACTAHTPLCFSRFFWLA